MIPTLREQLSRVLADAECGKLDTKVVLISVVQREAKVRVADFGTVAANAMLKTIRLGKDYA